MTKQPLAGALLLAAATLLSACASGPADMDRATGATVGDNPVTGARWNLLLVGTDERLSLPETPYFTVDGEGRLSGSDGCNQLMGEVRFGPNQRIDVAELATTRMACPQLDEAQRVTAMLDEAYRYLIDHDRLVLFGPDQRVLGGWRRAD